MNKEIVRITKRFTFETGHALFNYDGKCKYIHGHSYQLYVTVKGEVINELDNPKNGMVIDFSVLKKIVKEKVVDVFDHSFVINKHDTRDYIQNLEGERTIYLDVQPTCENLMMHFKTLIEESLPANLSLAVIRLFETEDSYSEWNYSDQL